MLIEFYTLRHVVTLAAAIHQILIAMEHPHNPTLIATDNIPTTGFVNNNMVIKNQNHGT